MPIDEMNESRVRVRDIAPTAIRMPPEMKQHLLRQAAIQGRTLHAEVLVRLKASMEPERTLPDGTAAPLAFAGERAAGQSGSVPVSATLDSTERAVLTVFRKLSTEKQLALLSLLR